MTAESITEGYFPTNSSLYEQLRFFISYAVLAPSSHNTQPWLYCFGNDYLDLLADRTKALPVVDPCDRELTISCGAAIDHLLVAGRYYGRNISVEAFPVIEDKDLLARFRLDGVTNVDQLDVDLFNAMTVRRTTRKKFQDRLIPPKLMTQCQRLAAKNGAILTFITEDKQRAAIAHLVTMADRTQFSDQRFRRELATWVHSRRALSKDGMSASGFGMPDSLSSMGAQLIRTFDVGKGVAANDLQKIMAGSPMLAVFSSATNTPVDWLSTGRALSQVLLALSASGVTASFLNSPIEVESLLCDLNEVVGAPGAPQLLMRFGYGPKVSSTVRRSVDQVLTR